MRPVKESLWQQLLSAACMVCRNPRRSLPVLVVMVVALAIHVAGTFAMADWRNFVLYLVVVIAGFCLVGWALYVTSRDQHSIPKKGRLRL